MNNLYLKPVQTINTSTQIMEQFVDMIRTNQLQQGTCLPSETSLAKSLGTSRATVREALSGLKALGLIKSVPGKGNFIQNIQMYYEFDNLIEAIKSRMNFLESLEARRAIEGEICVLAAKRRTDLSLHEIEEALKKCKNIQSVDQFINADYEFHLALAKASANSLFIQFIREALMKLDQPYYNIIKVAESADDASSSVERLFWKSYNDHEMIYQAIVKRDSSQARKNMIEHLQAARQKFIEYYEVKET